MNVGELKALLTKYPDDMPVVIDAFWSPSGCFSYYKEIEELQVYNSASGIVEIHPCAELLYRIVDAIEARDDSWEGVKPMLVIE